ncbi:MAG: toll/interleukin-1 receptor domain-containing protein [bacterium]|nr:TIR domain-containing protein [Gammaproteobacteria bacterium]HIL99158.1 TIR domain-containing protein [Pseudomonadales bacterium]
MSIESYRVPKHIVEELSLQSNRLVPIFRDRDELTTSGDLSITIKKALEDSENLIVICSPNAVESYWVNEEIRQFKRLGKSDRVFCVLVDDAVRSFPPAAMIDVDEDNPATTLETEPLAADLRPNSYQYSTDSRE